MFKKWDKIYRLENEIFHFSEKLDGTNSCIIIKDGSDVDFDPNIEPVEIVMNAQLIPMSMRLYTQSRTRLIYPGKERDNYGFSAWVKDNAEQLVKELGNGYHYGEWWGQGIQRNYNMDRKVFSLFNPTIKSELCPCVPQLGSSPDLSDIDGFIEALKVLGSSASKGFMKPEGVVVFAEKSQNYWKVTIDNKIENYKKRVL